MGLAEAGENEPAAVEETLRRARIRANAVAAAVRITRKLGVHSTMRGGAALGWGPGKGERLDWVSLL